MQAGPSTSALSNQAIAFPYAVICRPGFGKSAYLIERYSNEDEADQAAEDNSTLSVAYDPQGTYD